MSSNVPKEVEFTLSTEELGAIAQVSPRSIHASLVRVGAYFTLKPVKLPNGRLLWPSNSKERLLAVAQERVQQRKASRPRPKVKSSTTTAALTASRSGIPRDPA